MNISATQKSAGFTLIELVMVIVILGTLAAVALPRFVDLGTEATDATTDYQAGVTTTRTAIEEACLATGRAAADCAQ